MLRSTLGDSEDDLLSISNRFFEKLEARENGMEIYYYMVRCEYNAGLCQKREERDQRENFLDQAYRLQDLLVRLSKGGKVEKTRPRSRIVKELREKRKP